MKQLSRFCPFSLDFFRKITVVLTSVKFNENKGCLTAELAIISDSNDYADTSEDSYIKQKI